MFTHAFRPHYCAKQDKLFENTLNEENAQAQTGCGYWSLLVKLVKKLDN